jgi:hypothetical protein
MILCSNSCESNEGKAGASGLLLSAVLDRVITESKNCLSQNHKLFGYFLAAKSDRKKRYSFLFFFIDEKETKSQVQPHYY